MIKPRLTYANVAATLALVFSMTGGALAAKHYLITSTKQISPKVITALKGKNGKAGPAGPQGLPGKDGQSGREGPAGKNATIPTISFTPLTLENGWTNFSTFYGVPGYTKDIDGFVHLTGAVAGLSRTSEVIATLPAGFRPKVEGVWVRAASTNGSSDPHLVDLFIEQTGAIEAVPATGSTEAFVSLEGVTFYAG